MSAPVGPTGCEGAPGEGAIARWLIGASAGAFRSELIFDGDVEVDIQEILSLGSFGYRIHDRLSVQVAAGAVIDGELDAGAVAFDVDTGWATTITVARRWALGADDLWFITGTFSAGVSSTHTREMTPTGGGPRARLTAVDFRLGAMAGRTLWERVSPYLLLRGFGGPVFWEIAGDDVVGSDRFHVQLGLGVSVSLPRNVSIVVDGSAVGEQALSLGATVAF